MNHYKLHNKKDKLISTKVISSEIFRNEYGAIDLSSIMVGIIVIGLIGGVIASTVFVVIPWAQDNAAKQQLDSVVSAESAYFGLSANNPPALPAGAKANSFANSTELATAQLLGNGPNYCAITTVDGKGYTAYSKSASGAVFTVTDKNSKADRFDGSVPDPLPADCQFLAGGNATLPDVTPPVDNFVNLKFTSQGGALRALAVSADGTRMVGGDNYYAHIMLSTDSGKTWVKKVDSGIAGFAFNDFDMSADGTKMIAVGYAGTNPGSVWASTNSGNSWTKVKMGTTGTYGSSMYTSPKISDDGKIMTVTDTYYTTTFISTDNGVTWNSTSDLRNTAMSSDGNIIIGGQMTGSVYVYNSTKSVRLPPLAGAASASIRSISMSADGRIITVATTGNLYYLSKDSGATWTERTGPGAGVIYGVAVSDDGTKILLNKNSAGVYFSKDSGDTWIASSALSKPLGSLSFSPDSSKVYGIDGNPGAWWLGTFSP